MMQEAKFFGLQRCAAPYTRRSAIHRSKLSEVRMPELACQSAPAQAVLARQAWARRLRRLTPLPWPIPRVFGSGLRLDVHGTND